MDVALTVVLLSAPVAFLWLTALAWRRMQQKTTEYQLIAAMKALGIVQINKGRR